MGITPLIQITQATRFETRGGFVTLGAKNSAKFEAFHWLGLAWR